jgi:hypothetical protein
MAIDKYVKDLLAGFAGKGELGDFVLYCKRFR